MNHGYCSGDIGDDICDDIGELEPLLLLGNGWRKVLAVASSIFERSRFRHTVHTCYANAFTTQRGRVKQC